MSTYSDLLATHSPLAAWWMEDASTAGTQITDSSGNARHGTWLDTSSTNPPTASTAIVEGTTAASDMGTSAQAVTGSVVHGAWSNVTTAFTLILWIRPDATVSALKNLIIRDDGATSGTSVRHFRLQIAADGIPQILFWLGEEATVTKTLTGTSAVVAAEKYMLTFTFDGSTGRFFVNGVEVDSEAASGQFPVLGDPVIQFASTSTGFFDGSFQQAAYLGSTLTPTQVGALYAAGIPSTSSTVTLAGTAQAATAAFTVATVLAASLAGTVQAPTASFDLSASAQVSLAGTVQSPTGSFDVDAQAEEIDVSLAGTAQSPTAAFDVLAGASVALAGEVQPSVGAFALSAAAMVSLAGTVQSPTAEFDLSAVAVADRLVSMAGSARRSTAAFAITSQPAVQLAGVVRSATAAFTVDAQPTATLAGTVQPSLATFVTYVVAPVTPAPIVAAAHSMIVGRAFGAVTMQGSQAVYTVSSAAIPRARQRILVDNIDVTYFRGGITPNVTYTLLEPLLYGPATLDLPQVSACFERPGVGALSFLRPGAMVEVQRVLDDVVVATDYKGVIVAFDLSGRNLSVEIGGEASGRAALRNRQVPIFPRTNDLGRQFADSIRDLGLPFYPHLGPVTGIEAQTTGGTGHLEHIQNLVAKAWTRAGKHWTIMPDESTGAYEAHRKDDETIDGTVFIDDARTVANLRRDISEEPNRIYATGVTPAGQRVRFGVYPGLIQGPTPDFPGHMELGDAGDGVRLLIGKLHAMGYLKLADVAGGYDQDVYDAVVDLQIDAGLFDEGFTGTAVPGEVNQTTWNALYDLGVTGNSLEWAHIEPAAQRRKVRPWNRSASGGIMGANPLYDPNHLVRDRNVDLGAGLNRSQMREFSRATLHDSDDANWVGDITFHTGALIRGDGFQGMTVTAANVMDARELRPGMNLDLPQFDGGTLVHIAAIQVDEEGIVTATVDTRFRDAMEVWEVIARNKESRNDPARSRNQKHRSSTIVKDSIGEWDEIGGLLGNDVPLAAGWNVVEVIGAAEGTISRLRLMVGDTSTIVITGDGDETVIENLDGQEFACAVFGRSITADRLNNLIPAPLTVAGTKMWETKRAELKERRILYSAGTHDEPCGYSPGRKHFKSVEAEEPNPDYDPATDPDSEKVITVTTQESWGDVTGKHNDDAGFAYRSETRTVLYVAVWVRNEATLLGGRIMWPQLEAGV